MDSAHQKFTEQYRYSLDNLRSDYMEEIELFDTEFWELPQRAARLSAAVKRYKTSRMVSFILNMTIDRNLDMTPGLARKLCVNLFARTGSQKILVGVFGTAGRERKSNSNNEEVVVQMTLAYREQANEYWKETLSDIRIVQSEYQKAIGGK
ncbi:hypothetical protein [Vibrio coralliirubri]|uniref:hypothetical protein n=1 Tax=Vibrio coralliirubri TaxID=1516159 RepID=UPI0009E338B4|nr:hypothetical protein [Vibrio coralliirubri]